MHAPHPTAPPPVVHHACRFVGHCQALDTDNSVIQRRAQRIELGVDNIPQEMLDLLAE